MSVRDRLVHAVRIAQERRYGLETAEPVDFDRLGYVGTERYCYEPSRWRALSVALPRAAVSERDVFVDIGSGKGRIVFQAAARYRFRRVIGVELSEPLTAVARANIERNRARLRCRDVDLVTADALRWTMPDDLTVVFLHNPFTGELFRQVADRLVELTLRRGSGLRLIYVNPVEHHRLLATGHVKELPLPRSATLHRWTGFPGSGLRCYWVGDG